MTHRSVTLLLPGQGAQYPGMAVPLYEDDADFRAIVDETLELMGEEGRLVRQDWLSSDPSRPVDDGRSAQPLLFTIGYAVGRMLEQRGIRLGALLGHSVGELAAATLAGVFDLPGAARIMVARSRTLDTAPAGGMLAVAAAPEKVEPWIEQEWVDLGVVVGAVNGPSQTVLAGPEAPLLLAEQALCDVGLVTRRVRAREPFHSPALEEAARTFGEAVAAERLHLPEVRIWSARTGRPLQPHEALDPMFWARQMAEPVLYWSALTGLLDDSDGVLVETGPGNSLSAPARRHPSVRSGRSTVVCLLPTERGDCRSAWTAGLERLDALGATWTVNAR
ncbi:acyltransferase domain-containing protein [Streptomyces avermitilis]|uniref:acyltransferase domain-containing protein n=1 Tax=Streptomyces avermitilis TaxID=33903 RepID=UPI0033CE0311